MKTCCLCSSIFRRNLGEVILTLLLRRLNVAVSQLSVPVPMIVCDFVSKLCPQTVILIFRFTSIYRILLWEIVSRQDRSVVKAAPE